MKSSAQQNPSPCKKKKTVEKGEETAYRMAEEVRKTAY